MSEFDKELYWKKRKLGLRGQNEVLGTPRAKREIRKIVKNPLKYSSLIKRQSLKEQIDEGTEFTGNEGQDKPRRRRGKADRQ